ncbi:hypothetical protein D3C85_1166620 [compost metagenome]
MLGAGVNLELLDHRVTQRTLRQHAFYGFLQNALRELVLQFGEVALVDTTRVARVAIVFLVQCLVTGYAQFFCVNDNNVITSINVRSELRLMLAT